MRAYERNQYLQSAATYALIALYVIALARAFAVPFTPFIYFRF